MSQLYYPVGGNDFINTTDYVEYSNNLQNIYLNVENNIVRNKNSEPLVELKDSLYKELTSDCNELFQEIIEGINKAKAGLILTIFWTVSLHLYSLSTISVTRKDPLSE